MSTYIEQLLSDIEAAILARWRECPPHYFEMGLPERYLDPPDGYDGPSSGFCLREDKTLPLPMQDPNESQDVSDSPSIESEKFMEDQEFERSIAEMERWRDEEPPSRQNMYYHFGFRKEQFPPSKNLTDSELDSVVLALCRLWAAFNFTPVFPDEVPGRILYPLLLKRMEYPTFVMTKGNLGVEFCNYTPEECPFGLEWCRCKEYLD